MQTVKYSAGDTILNQGDEGDTAFLIVDGCTDGKSREPLKWFLGEVSEEITESQTTRVVVVQSRGGRSIALEQLLRCSTVKVDLLNVEFSERVPSVGDLVQVEGPLLDPCELIAAEFVPMR